jgi:hypothetical protein
MKKMSWRFSRQGKLDGGSHVLRRFLELLRPRPNEVEVVDGDLRVMTCMEIHSAIKIEEGFRR